MFLTIKFRPGTKHPCTNLHWDETTINRLKPPEARSRMGALDCVRAGIKNAQLIVCARPIFYFLFFQFLMGSVMDINKLYQYITFNFINITIKKNIAINTGILWRRPVLGQSEIVCTVPILDVQGDTAISLCRERSLARRRALAFRRGALGRAARAHIVERAFQK